MSMGQNRSASGDTQFSAKMSPTQYIHPMRQVSHPCIPPRGAFGSDLDERHAVKVDGRPSTPDGRDWHTNRSSSVGTETRRSFNFTNDSLSLFPTSSYTNVAGTTASTQSRTVSPISRSSLEFPFRSKSRTSTSTDPIARAAAVQAARQAFEDREAAKARKFEKAQDKELFRRERKEQEQKQLKQKCTYLGDFYGEMNLRSEDSRRQSGSARQSRDLYRDATYGPLVEKTEGYKMRDPKSAWLLFLTWLRTRIFKIGRRIKEKSV